MVVKLNMAKLYNMFILFYDNLCNMIEKRAVKCKSKDISIGSNSCIQKFANDDIMLRDIKFDENVMKNLELANEKCSERHTQMFVAVRGSIVDIPTANKIVLATADTSFYEDNLDLYYDNCIQHQGAMNVLDIDSNVSEVGFNSVLGCSSKVHVNGCGWLRCDGSIAKDFVVPICDFDMFCIIADVCRVASISDDVDMRVYVASVDDSWNDVESLSRFIEDLTAEDKWIESCLACISTSGGVVSVQCPEEVYGKFLQDVS